MAGTNTTIAQYPALARDVSDRQPDGGYVVPLLPVQWVGDAPQLKAWAAVLDRALDAVRLAIGVMRQAHHVQNAVGGDLDDLASLFGIARGPAETDDQLRVRIPATVGRGLQAATEPDMAAALAAIYNVPVTVVDGASAAVFIVTFLQNTPALLGANAFIRKIKPAGTVFSSRVYVPLGATSARVGAFRVGDVPVGGGGNFIPLPG